MFSCGRESEKMIACGVENPQQNISWLAELIQKTEDKNADIPYVGTIWLVRYKGEDIFVSDISPMRSASRAYYLFDCAGNDFKPDNSDGFNKVMEKRRIVIFSNWEH